jgi:hypothetical protein
MKIPLRQQGGPLEKAFFAPASTICRTLRKHIQYAHARAIAYDGYVNAPLSVALRILADLKLFSWRTLASRSTCSNPRSWQEASLWSTPMQLPKASGQLVYMTNLSLLLCIMQAPDLPRRTHGTKCHPT